MELAVGEIVEGKVTGITKYGAFVSLPGGKSGMVHISEISYSYVNEVSDSLAVGQDVKVKIIAMENGRINLSIKQTEPAPARANRGRGGSSHTSTGAQSGTRQGSGNRNTGRSNYHASGRTAGGRQNTDSGSKDQSFDDMLKRFMDDSNSKLSSIKQYADHRTRGKRR